MPTPLDPGPFIYAHRGDFAHARGNSIEAFTLAAEAGADGIELDVRRTSDGRLILAHDASHPALGPLSERTYHEIREADPLIATLAEGLAAIPGSMYVNGEIKNHRGEPGFDSSRGIVDQTIAELENRDDLKRILLSSFDPSSVRRAGVVSPDVLRGLLVTDPTPDWVAIRWAKTARHHAVHLPRTHLLKNPSRTVKRANRAGLKVVVWTVDDPDEIADLFQAGVVAVVTNDPAVGRAVIDAL
ncbi:MAG: glycerophosphodiester phosphodiesterase [Actinomycetota bacterium]|nr:glycerophosphodiester phosphodiesterase [Actinomycetota bacterium]